MPLTIWQQSGRRCTVSVNGAAIAVQLLDGDNLLQERAVTSADQALSLAEAWKIDRRTEAKVPSPRRRPAAPRPRAHDADGATAVPRVMWIDRR